MFLINKRQGGASRCATSTAACAGSPNTASSVSRPPGVLPAPFVSGLDASQRQGQWKYTTSLNLPTGRLRARSSLSESAIPLLSYRDPSPITLGVRLNTYHSRPPSLILPYGTTGRGKPTGRSFQVHSRARQRKTRIWRTGVRWRQDDSSRCQNSVRVRGGGSGRKANGDQQGTGGGGGLVAKPVGVVEITQSQTRFVPITPHWTLVAAVAFGVCLGILAFPKVPTRERD